MKFSTKGDGGETSLLGGQRVPKFDLRPDTYGVLDEASSALGVVRAMTKDQRLKDIVFSVQKDLLAMGAELSSMSVDIPRLSIRIGAGDVHRIADIIDELQENVKLKNEFIYPGETVLAAHIDVARTIIRRAERNAARLKQEGLVNNPDIHQYLNRLADMLFVLARYEEQHT
jgi:cob(I)alamin adenosyltransferase